MTEKGIELHSNNFPKLIENTLDFGNVSLRSNLA